MGDWLSVLSLCLAVVALSVSWWQSHRGVAVAGNANEIQVVADIFRDVRSEEFRGKLDAVLKHSIDGPLDSGFESLGGLREDAYAVCYFFEDLGVLVTNGLIRRAIILDTVSSIMTRAWYALQPAIAAERAYRRRTYPAAVSPTFLPHFEQLVAMAVSRRSGPARSSVRGVRDPAAQAAHAELPSR